VCLHVPGPGILFSGDTLYRITDHLGAYPRVYLATLERLARLDIRTIYPGHGQPITQDAAGFIRACLDNVSQSLLQD
jgi:glyoxylase-like metal-dependent hydrolase (beta-lactamase superfamily II)